MELLLQNVLVGVIVASCVIFSAWRLISPRLRLKTLDLVGPVMETLGARGTVARLRTQTIGKLAGGCSACPANKSAVHQPGRR